MMTKNTMKMIDMWEDAMEEVVLACKYSTDPVTQNASSLFDDSGHWVDGPYVNSFPAGVKETEDRWKRPQKYYFVEHAERKAILHAARLGICTEGYTLVCPFAACADCARAIVESGIKRLVRLAPAKSCEHTHNRWHESCAAGDTILKESGVEIIEIDKHFGVEILRSGELVTV